MEFRNLTPFDTLCYSALDPNDDEHRVIAMKVAYRLVRQGDGSWRAQLIDDEPVPLCMGDEYWGEPGASSVRQESDLAPFKPRCDVLVFGQAHAPGGRAATQWETRLKVTVLEAPAVEAVYEQKAQWQPGRQRYVSRPGFEQTKEKVQKVLLDKRLWIFGPHTFQRQSMGSGWKRTAPQAITELPLRWDHAFGGASLVRDDADPTAEPLLHEVCFSNPLGSGWLDKREPRIRRKAGQQERKEITAPQIVQSDEPLPAPVMGEHPEGSVDARKMAELAHAYGVAPAGYGPLGRAWAPRLALAGTYDDTWLQTRHPGVPSDIDFRYWNGAPDDQQLPYLPPDFCLEAWNLTPHATTGGHVRVVMPGHRPFLLMRMDSGVMLPLPMITDTVILDTEAMTLTLTHRTWIPAGSPGIRVLEARFEVDPAEPLVRRAPKNSSALQEA
ncbi:Uncharacterized protein conserved in bacteria [Bordetella ansorpii]|uniref:Uncharacterized protein conserved in bacteria n=1 Tax=Bordetella ansorpii TaxID=288768 RepID=A0A157SHK3_9BORD|nr:DUF2169 domain-containing protein [Bordetella ansorpii]SAI69938.1 Uncharacterized protein conserved in bacteria [Bordetella ansorpii]